MDKEKNYTQFAEVLSEVISLENELHNKKRLLQSLSDDIKNDKNSSCIGIEFTSHSFRQLSERLEIISRESPVIFKDIYRPDSPSESLFIPSNLKSFAITLLSDAYNKKHFNEEVSKSKQSEDDSFEYRYTIDMNKWSGEKKLKFIAIIENFVIKTCFFNWV